MFDSLLVGCAWFDPGDPERERLSVRRKMENGADFALTQPVFDVEAAQRFLTR
ncbi:MAG: hypothetical protein U0401_03795 [Anaerolineae bacterium]